MRILLDTNVVLDVALEREPFCEAAAKILDASDFRRFHLFITASSATDLYYVLRKEKGREAGLEVHQAATRMHRRVRRGQRHPHRRVGLGIPGL